MATRTAKAAACPYQGTRVPGNRPDAARLSHTRPRPEYRLTAARRLPKDAVFVNLSGGTKDGGAGARIGH